MTFGLPHYHYIICMPVAMKKWKEMMITVTIKLGAPPMFRQNQMRSTKALRELGEYGT